MAPSQASGTQLVNQQQTGQDVQFIRASRIQQVDKLNISINDAVEFYKVTNIHPRDLSLEKVLSWYDCSWRVVLPGYESTSFQYCDPQSLLRVLARPDEDINNYRFWLAQTLHYGLPIAYEMQTMQTQFRELFKHNEETGVCQIVTDEVAALRKKIRAKSVYIKEESEDDSPRRPDKPVETIEKSSQRPPTKNNRTEKSAETRSLARNPKSTLSAKPTRSFRGVADVDSDDGTGSVYRDLPSNRPDSDTEVDDEEIVPVSTRSQGNKRSANAPASPIPTPNFTLEVPLRTSDLSASTSQRSAGATTAFSAEDIAQARAGKHRAIDSSSSSGLEHPESSQDAESEEADEADLLRAPVPDLARFSEVPQSQEEEDLQVATALRLSIGPQLAPDTFGGGDRLRLGGVSVAAQDVDVPESSGSECAAIIELEADSAEASAQSTSDKIVEVDGDDKTEVTSTDNRPVTNSVPALLTKEDRKKLRKKRTRQAKKARIAAVVERNACGIYGCGGCNGYFYTEDQLAAHKKASKHKSKISGTSAGLSNSEKSILESWRNRFCFANSLDDSRFMILLNAALRGPETKKWPDTSVSRVKILSAYFRTLPTRSRVSMKELWDDFWVNQASVGGAQQAFMGLAAQRKEVPVPKLAQKPSSSDRGAPKQPANRSTSTAPSAKLKKSRAEKNFSFDNSKIRLWRQGDDMEAGVLYRRIAYQDYAIRSIYDSVGVMTGLFPQTLLEDFQAREKKERALVKSLAKAEARRKPADPPRYNEQRKLTGAQRFDFVMQGRPEQSLLPVQPAPAPAHIGGPPGLFTVEGTSNIPWQLDMMKDTDPPHLISPFPRGKDKAPPTANKLSVDYDKASSKQHMQKGGASNLQATDTNSVSTPRLKRKRVVVDDDDLEFVVNADKGDNSAATPSRHVSANKNMDIFVTSAKRLKSSRGSPVSDATKPSSAKSKKRRDNAAGNATAVPRSRPKTPLTDITSKVSNGVSPASVSLRFASVEIPSPITTVSNPSNRRETTKPTPSSPPVEPRVSRNPLGQNGKEEMWLQAVTVHDLALSRTSLGRFECLWRGCKQSFLTLQELYYHNLNDHFPAKKCLWGGICNEKGLNGTEVGKHLYYHIPYKVYKCHLCPHQANTEPRALTAHFDTNHRGESPCLEHPEVIHPEFPRDVDGRSSKPRAAKQLSTGLVHGKGSSSDPSSSSSSSSEDESMKENPNEASAGESDQSPIHNGEHDEDTGEREGDQDHHTSDDMDGSDHETEVDPVEDGGEHREPDSEPGSDGENDDALSDASPSDDSDNDADDESDDSGDDLEERAFEDEDEEWTDEKRDKCAALRREAESAQNEAARAQQVLTNLEQERAVALTSKENFSARAEELADDIEKGNVQLAAMIGKKRSKNRRELRKKLDAMQSEKLRLEMDLRHCDQRLNELDQEVEASKTAYENAETAMEDASALYAQSKKRLPLSFLPRLSNGSIRLIYEDEITGELQSKLQHVRNAPHDFTVQQRRLIHQNRKDWQAILVQIKAGEMETVLEAHVRYKAVAINNARVGSQKRKRGDQDEVFQESFRRTRLDSSRANKRLKKAHKRKISSVISG